MTLRVVFRRAARREFDDAADRYIELATTLATDRTSAQRLRQRVAVRNAVLFENVEKVRAFEDCL